LGWRNRRRQAQYWRKILRAIRYTNAQSNVNGYEYSFLYTNIYSYSYSNINSYGHEHSFPYTDIDTYGYSVPYTNING